MGPLFGGWLATNFSWQWPFGINIPITIIIAIAVKFSVSESRERQAGMTSDLFGALLSLVGSAALTGGLIEGRNYRWRLTEWGLPLAIIGVLGLGFTISSTSNWLSVTPFLLIYRISVVLATDQLTGVVLYDVPLERSGQGSGTQSTARQVGSALGIAILGTILFISTGSALDARLAQNMPDLPAETRSQIVDSVVVSAGSAIPALRQKDAAIGQAAGEAFSDGTRYCAFAAAGFLIAGLGATL